MSRTPVPGDSLWPNRQVGGGPLSTIVYRSQAVREMSPPDLRDLTVTSQARNSREAVTGLMLYDGAQFFQWIEGPPDNVERLMGSICRDKRHTGIEILDRQAASKRVFGDWSMKLAAHYPAVEGCRADVIAPPREIVEGLRRRPDAAPTLLTELAGAAGQSQAEDASTLDPTRQMKLSPGAAETLRQVILSVVIPRLFGGISTVEANPPSALACELAELLIASQDDAALELMRELHGGVGRTGRLYSTLLEPAARRLGDLWNEDVCSEFDLTLGLCRLQTAVRLLTTEEVIRPLDSLEQPSVLIVPEPGEMHRLGSVLDNTVLHGAGWAPQSEFPRNDSVLQEMVSSRWFDVLDLSLSVALRREHFLPRVTETIMRARLASQNPDLLVVVGGRVFVEQAGAGMRVGADVTSKTAGNVDQSILRTMGQTRSMTETYEFSGEVTATPS